MDGLLCYFRDLRSYEISHPLQNKGTQNKPPPTVPKNFKIPYFQDLDSIFRMGSNEREMTVLISMNV